MNPVSDLDPTHDQVRFEHGFHELRVEAVVEETPDTRSFVLGAPEELSDLFGYRPGQFCTFRVHIDDAEHLRSYSMSSAPGTGGNEHCLTVTVKRVPGGLVSNWLHDNVVAGDVLEATKPAGVFCASEGTAPLVAFCGGSGITPVMSIATAALAEPERRVRLLYASRDRDSVIFADRLEGLAQEHADRFELELHLDERSGFLQAAAVAEFAGGDPESHYFICGPTPFMDLVEQTLLGSGVPPERISIERFVNAGQEPGAAPPEALEDAGESTTETVTVILGGQPTEIAYQAGDTILLTARRAGLSAPYSCEAGNCATCMALLKEGSVEMRTNNALDPDEVAEGWVLSCQSIPTSKRVTVEYESL